MLFLLSGNYWFDFMRDVLRMWLVDDFEQQKLP